MTVPTPNQSYLVKNMEAKIAACLGVVMADLGANITGRSHDVAPYKPYDLIYYADGWRKDSESFAFRRHQASRSPLSEVRFVMPRWDSQHSDIKYGKRTLDQNVNENDPSKSKVIRNNTDDLLHVAYEESVELTNSFSSSITKGVTLDISEDMEVASEQKVTGEYAGVSAEVGLSEKFGISKSKSQSSEEGKEKSEEGTKSETLAIDFDAKPRVYYLVEVTFEHEKTRQPFDIDGIMDFDFALVFNDPIHSGPHGRLFKGTTKISGVDGLEQWVYGFDTDHPEMHGYYEHAPANVKAAVEWIRDPQNRRIQVSGLNFASLDSNAEYNVEELGDHVPSALGSLPIQNAIDVTI